MNKIAKKFLATALVLPILYGNNIANAKVRVENSLPQCSEGGKSLSWGSMSTAQKVAAIGVPSVVGATIIGITLTCLFVNSGKLSVVMIGGNEKNQDLLVDCLRRRAANGRESTKVADILSEVADEKKKQILGRVAESAAKFNKWRINKICTDQNGVLIDNPKNSELINSADVIIVVSDSDEQTHYIHDYIGKATKKPPLENGKLVVHACEMFKRIKALVAKLGDVEAQKFLVPTVNITNCQHRHTTSVPSGEGLAKSSNPFKNQLVRSHLNEALRLNRQGVQFNDAFFKDCVLPQWRKEYEEVRKCMTKQELDTQMSVGSMRRTFTDNTFLRGLKPDSTSGYRTLEDYIFGNWKGHKKTRIKSLKETDQEIYNKFWDEISWINANQEFLEEEDPMQDVDPSTGKRPPYKNRLILTALDIHGECDTEFRSFIEAWGDDLDDLSLIKENKAAVSVDKGEAVKRVLTSVRNTCLEDLARKAALDMNLHHNAGVAFVPEMQAIIRRQFATALNLPSDKVAKDNEECMPTECGVVYSTNILSSIMNIESIAAGATKFAQKLDMANRFEPILLDFDDTISYTECCKILDRSARHMLKNDERTFDERFRAAINEYVCSGNVDEDTLTLFCNWINGTNNESFSEICGYLALGIGDSGKSYLPEVYCSSPEKFGHLTFTKYLVDQGIIALTD